MCVELGTFDEKNIGRDRTPDKSVKHLAAGITGSSYFPRRPYLAYVLTSLVNVAQPT